MPPSPFLRASALAAALLFAICWFVPVISVTGPVLGTASFTPAGLVGDALRGGNGEKPREKSGLERSLGDRLGKELDGIQVPLRGPVLLGVAAAAYAIAHLALLISLVLLARGRHPARSTLAWAVGGIAFAVLFAIGCSVTQASLNDIHGQKLSHQILSLVSKAVGSAYEIRCGWGAYLLGGTAALLLLARLGSRPASSPPQA